MAQNLVINPKDLETRLLHSYAEARAVLGDVPVSTFALWIRQGLVHPIKIGPRRCFISHEELLRLASGKAA